MTLHDFGSLVWAIFILIAVISSVVRNASRSRTRIAPGAASAISNSARAAPSNAGVIPSSAVVVPSNAGVIPSNAVVMPSNAGVIPSLSREAPKSIARLVVPQARRTPRIGTFRGRGALVRGVVALEVLGPPRALREWKPIV